MINIGDTFPNTSVTIIDQDGQQNMAASDFVAGKKVVLFALPGAFTPTCSETHMPGFVVNYDDIISKGVDVVACLSVNDAFVMKAWQQQQNAEKLVMLADGGAALTKALGLTLETRDFGGTRSQRYSMIIENGKVTALNIEQGKDFKVSDADTILTQL